jgi:hypothetical protein
MRGGVGSWRGTDSCCLRKCGETRLIFIKLYSRMRRASCRLSHRQFLSSAWVVSLGSLLGFGKMRGLIIIGIVLVAVSAMRHGSFRPLPTAPMPVVNVP